MKLKQINKGHKCPNCKKFGLKPCRNDEWAVNYYRCLSCFAEFTEDLRFFEHKVTKKIITKEDILKQENEDEIFCLIEEFLLRAREKGLFTAENSNYKKEIILTDMQKINIIRDMIKANKGERK